MYQLRRLSDRMPHPNAEAQEDPGLWGASGQGFRQVCPRVKLRLLSIRGPLILTTSVFLL